MADNKVNKVSNDNANFIWGIADRLRGIYKPTEYGKVILPFTVIRRFDCCLEGTKEKVAEFEDWQLESFDMDAYKEITGFPFINTANISLKDLLGDSDALADNFKAYLGKFSTEVRNILDAFKINDVIDTLNSEGLLYTTLEAFANLDLYPDHVDTTEMGYIFENLVSRFQENETAGQFYTARDIVKLLTAIALEKFKETDIKDHVIIKIADYTSGTCGMLSFCSDDVIALWKKNGKTPIIELYGQEFMPDTWAIGAAEMLIKGFNIEHIVRANSLMTDAAEDTEFDIIIMNPPFGTPWKGDKAPAGQAKVVENELRKGSLGRYGLSCMGGKMPGGSDSQLLFLMQATHKLKKDGILVIITNASPLFSGDTSSYESQARRYLLENDLISAIIRMPQDMFYNTNISTFVWVITPNKPENRKGKIQLINTDEIYTKLRKSLGKKNKEYSEKDRQQIVQIYRDFKETEVSKIYNNTEFIFKEYTTYRPELDESGNVVKDKKGEIKLDKSSKDSEIVPLNMNIDEYMAKEVLPFAPGTIAKYEEGKSGSKTGAEIPFNRCFYVYEKPKKSKDVMSEISLLDEEINSLIGGLINE